MCAAAVPGFQGPYGQPVPVAAPYSVHPPTGADLARQMVRRSVPLDLVQQAGFAPDGNSGVLQAQGFVPPPTLAPPGLPAAPPVPGLPGAPGPAFPGRRNARAGFPGPGFPPPFAGGNPFVPGHGPPGVVAAVGALTGGPAPFPVPTQRTEVRFTGPNGMRIAWFAPTADGKAGFGTQYLEAPGRYNFLQAAIYRLKLSDIPNRPGVELYPTLEVVPGNAKTATFLAHSAVPVTFTEEDFNQVAAGNFLVKVIYLPDPQFQDLASTGTDEVISSRLEPGVDPIAEAHRRGSILLVVRLGNIDLEAPNTPAMDAPSPYAPRLPFPATDPDAARAVPARRAEPSHRARPPAGPAAAAAAGARGDPGIAVAEPAAAHLIAVVETARGRAGRAGRPGGQGDEAGRGRRASARGVHAAARARPVGADRADQLTGSFKEKASGRRKPAGSARTSRLTPAARPESRRGPQAMKTPCAVTAALLASAALLGAAVGQPPPLPERGPSPLLYVRFAGPAGMRAAFYQGRPEGRTFDAPVMVGLRPGYLYRIRLSGFTDRPGLAVYPTLEVRGSLSLTSHVRRVGLPRPGRRHGRRPAHRRGRNAGDEGDLPRRSGQGRSRFGDDGDGRAAEPRPAERGPPPRPADAGGAPRRPRAAAGRAGGRLGPQHDPPPRRTFPGPAARRAVSAVDRLPFLRPDPRPASADGGMFSRRRRPRPAGRHRPRRPAGRAGRRGHHRRIHRRRRPTARRRLQPHLPLFAAVRRPPQPAAAGELRVRRRPARHAGREGTDTSVAADAEPAKSPIRRAEIDLEQGAAERSAGRPGAGRTGARGGAGGGATSTWG